MTPAPRLPAPVRSAIDRISDRWPKLGAFLDRQRASTFEHWNDGLNGQRERRRSVKEIVEQTGVAAFVETGTHRGATAAYARRVFGLPVWTCELVPRSYELCRWRFRHDDDVHLHVGDSRAFLRAMSRELAGRRCLFYLDAHWYVDLPLADELRIIASAWDEWVVVIDDFRVEDDPKYYFDEYGADGVLEYSYLPMADLDQTAVFWPAASGLEESFPWRGSIVLGHGEAVIKGLHACATLRSRDPS